MSRININREVITDKETRALFIGIMSVIALIAIGFFTFSDGYTTNVYTETISVISTIAVIDRLNRRRDRIELKERLFNELKSTVSGQSASALDWIRREGWLQSDPLKGEDLYRINWEGAYIGDLNLENANLSRSNLQNATNEYRPAQPLSVSLKNANLEDADLHCIMLKQSNLERANLRNAKLPQAIMTNSSCMNADLTNANLEGADLQHVNFNGSKLFRANLKGADIRGAKFDTALFDETGKSSFPAIMPDGERWTPDTDINAFVDEKHPHFLTRLQAVNKVRREIGLQILRLK